MELPKHYVLTVSQYGDGEWQQLYTALFDNSELAQKTGQWIENAAKDRGPGAYLVRIFEIGPSEVNILPEKLVTEIREILKLDIKPPEA